MSEQRGREKGDVGGGQIATPRKRRRQSIAATPASRRVRWQGSAIAHRSCCFSLLSPLTPLQILLLPLPQPPSASPPRAFLFLISAASSFASVAVPSSSPQPTLFPSQPQLSSLFHPSLSSHPLLTHAVSLPQPLQTFLFAVSATSTLLPLLQTCLLPQLLPFRFFPRLLSLFRFYYESSLFFLLSTSPTTSFSALQPPFSIFPSSFLIPPTAVLFVPRETSLSQRFLFLLRDSSLSSLQPPSPCPAVVHLAGFFLLFGESLFLRPWIPARIQASTVCVRTL